MSRFDRFTTVKYGQKQSNKLEELDGPNLNLFTTFSFDLLNDDELLSGTNYFFEQTETSEAFDQTEQTETSGDLNNNDVDNFNVANRNENTTKKTQSDLNI